MNYNKISRATIEEKKMLMNLSLGRIFKLMSRPFQKGDIQQYEEAKAIFIQCAEDLGLKKDVTEFHVPGTNFGKRIIAE